jgi:hypothetical protein
VHTTKAGVPFARLAARTALACVFACVLACGMASSGGSSATSDSGLDVGTSSGSSGSSSGTLSDGGSGSSSGGSPGEASDARASADGGDASTGADAGTIWSCLSLYAPPASRDPGVWPFAIDSPWNTPIGSGAQYAAASDPSTSDLTTDGATINFGQWSEPVYVGTTADPMCNVYGQSGLLGTINCAAGAQPDDTSDGSLILIDAAHMYSYELGAAMKVSDGWQAGSGGGKVDLTGQGIDDPAWRAYAGSAVGGLIRRGELANVISHPLAFAIDSSRQTQSWIWPAFSNDYRNDYAGHLPMGTLAAIPSGVDICNLGLSAAGLVFARAAQDYGAYLVDSSTGLAFYADESMAGDGTQQQLVSQASGDLATIIAQMRVVTNSSQTTVGGGGTTRRAPPAPALAP